MDFWSTVRKIKDGNNCEMFSLINSLVLYILTFPHSSAYVEILFSSINLNKTKSRNRLPTETLSGIFIQKMKFTTNKSHVIILTFQPICLKSIIAKYIKIVLYTFMNTCKFYVMNFTLKRY